MIAEKQATVVCLKSGKKYDATYVNRLHSMVSRHLSLPHRFLCLTEDPAGVSCETEMLDANLDGWWHKITLFRPEPYGIRGRMLFIDLDTVITGSLDEMATYPADFCILDDFLGNGYGSGVFLLEAGARPQVWEQFNEHVPQRFYGDQDWISSQLAGEATWPKEWCRSYRLHAREAIPEGAKMICFHGQPKMDQCSGWVAEYWR
jgi:hypothetical protein